MYMCGICWHYPFSPLAVDDNSPDSRLFPSEKQKELYMGSGLMVNMPSPAFLLTSFLSFNAIKTFEISNRRSLDFSDEPLFL